MRPPIPLEDQHEVFVLMKEMLPGLDKALVDELAADYLLAALICIDFEDLNYVLIRPGPFVSGTSRVSSAADFKDTAEQLLKRLLEESFPTAPPSGALIVIRAFPGLSFDLFNESLARLTEILHDATECFLGYFFDPEGTEGKIRIYLTGEVDVRASGALGDRQCHLPEAIPSFLKDQQ